MGGHIVQGRDQSNSPCKTSLPLLLFHSLGRCEIYNLTKYYDIAMVWYLGYASIRDHTKSGKNSGDMIDL